MPSCRREAESAFSEDKNLENLLGTSSSHQSVDQRYTTNSRLLRLPLELISNIIKLLPSPDIKNIRLTCKELLSQGNTHLQIESAFVDCRTPVLRELTAISEHECFRHKIRTIVVSFCEINAVITFDDYLEIVSRSGATLTQDLDVAYKHYAEIFLDQTSLMMMGEYKRTIQSAIGRMPNTTQLVILSTLWGTHPDSLYWEQCDKDGLPTPRLLRAENPTFERLAFKTIMQELHHHKINLSSLISMPCDPDRNVYSKMWTWPVTLLPIQYVKDLTIQESEALGHVVSLLRGIKRMVFEWTYGLFKLSDYKFDQLEELHVSGFVLWPDNLVQFIRIHRPTLKHITIKRLIRPCLATVI
jgi:hypothetical protein